MRWAKYKVLAAALSAIATFVVLVGAAWAAPPSNDGFAGATVISSVPFTTTEDTTQATLDSDDTAAGQVCNTGGLTFSNSVWFAYTPTTDQVVGLDTSGSSYGVAGAVVSGSPGSFTAASCFLGGTSFQASAGTTYYLDLAQSPAGSGGTLSLSLTPLVAPNATLTVDSSGSFDSKSGAATMTGTASCNSGASAFVFGNLSQSVGRIATISGSGSPASPIICDGTPHPWSFVVTPSSGLFKGGHAAADVSMFACSFTCQTQEVTETIQLKH